MVELSLYIDLIFCLLFFMFLMQNYALFKHDTCERSKKVDVEALQHPVKSLYNSVLSSLSIQRISSETRKYFLVKILVV